MDIKTLTVDEVKLLHEEHLVFAKTGIAPEGFDPRKSTRVVVKARLNELNPAPYTSITPEMQAQRDRRAALTYREREEQIHHQRLQVSDEDHQAFARARSGPDGKHVLDALHFAQKSHSTALHEEADRIVDLALGNLPG